MGKIEKINDNTGITANSKQLEILKKHFPNCFDKNGDFVPHKMAEIVGKSELEFSRESYSLNWLGKSYARLLANENPLTLLAEDKEHNQKEENKNSQNILIKGDNLEVLKHLKNAYSEKIKMIYIDPPYNTGSDGFVYEDDRKFTIEELSKLAGIELEEAKRILEFTKSKANSHSAWLTFMYPRLYVARELLKDDGVIFISIDDNEVAQLKMLCDEVFGEENFVAQFPRITKKAGKTTDLIAKNTDYLVCYRNTNKAILEKNSFDDSKYDEIDEHNEERGNFKLSQTLDYGSIQYSKSLDYEIELDNKIYRPGNVTKEQMKARQLANPKSDFCWRWSKKLFEFGLKAGFVVVKNDRIYTKTYKNAVINKNKQGYFVEIQERKKATSSLEFIDNEYSNDNAKKDISKYFDEKVFEYPKPISLIRKITEIATNSNDYILDFFAGSGTTGDAVMQLNAEDRGDRRYILVQLPEPINSKENKTAYDFVKNELKINKPTIFDITKARIEKAADAIKDKKPDYDGDFGFRIFETVPVFDGYLDDMEELEEGRTLFDGSMLDDTQLGYLLTTWKVYDGIELTTDLSVVRLGNYEAYYHDKILYFMDKGFDTEALKAFMAKLDDDKAFNPSKVVVFGYNFTSKHQRELKEALGVYKNKKAIELDVAVRY